MIRGCVCFEEWQTLWDLQIGVHLLECAVRLLEEVEYNASAEFAFLLIVVHLEDLLKGRPIDAVSEFGESGRALFALFTVSQSVVEYD